MYSPPFLQLAILGSLSIRYDVKHISRISVKVVDSHMPHKSTCLRTYPLQVQVFYEIGHLLAALSVSQQIHAYFVGRWCGWGSSVSVHVIG